MAAADAQEIYYPAAPPTGAGGDLLLSRTDSAYDTLGQNYQTTTYAVNSSGGLDANPQVTDNWYDADGNLLMTQTSGSQEFTKYAYDGMNQVTEEYDGYYTGSGAISYTEASAVTNSDAIYEQTDNSYDAAGELTFVVTHQRNYDDSTSAGAGRLRRRRRRAEVAHQLRRQLLRRRGRSDRHGRLRHERQRPMSAPTSAADVPVWNDADENWASCPTARSSRPPSTTTPARSPKRSTTPETSSNILMTTPETWFRPSKTFRTPRHRASPGTRPTW